MGAAALVASESSEMLKVFSGDSRVITIAENLPWIDFIKGSCSAYFFFNFPVFVGFF